MGKTSLPCVLSMKDSIYGLSLGTLVRQMMCGIVFFIPIVLCNNSDWDSIVAWLRNWNAAGLIAFGAVAACIGTLIYHVEKNLWAYFWQTLRIRKSWKGRNWVYIVSYLMMLLPLAMLFLWKAEASISWKAIIITVILAVVFPILMLIKPWKMLLLEKTQQMWKASSKLPENLDADIKHSEANNSASTITPLQLLKLYELKEIARREAGWADYIHCGQTSAFAWILGCIPVMTNSAASPAPGWLIPSIWGAIWLLGFEMLCEIHKQMHINRLLSEYKALKQKMR